MAQVTSAKHGNHTAEDDDPSPPPPYSESSYLPSSSSSPIMSSGLAAHFAALPAHLRAESDLRAAADLGADLEAAAAALPHVSAFIDALARRPPPRRRAELVLVPAAAVSSDWALSGAAERRREGEMVRVARIAGPGVETEKGSSRGNEKGGGGWEEGKKHGDDGGDADSDDWDGRRAGRGGRIGEFDDWGRWEGNSRRRQPQNWWWEDETMAQRIAACLRPEDIANGKDGEKEAQVDRRQVQAAVEENKIKKKTRTGGLGFFSRKKSDAASREATSTTTTTVADGGVLAGAGGRREKPSSTMTVRAEEVTFRRENAMGIWESLSGFGIVIVVRIPRV